MTETIRPRTSYVLGVDPGTTTGLALTRFDADGRPTFEWQDQLAWNAACAKLELWLPRLSFRVKKSGSAVRAACACEKFTLNAQTAQRGQGPAEDSMGMCGVVRWECQKAGITLGKPEQASAAKNLFGDKLLKALDLYAVGMKHANDAMRHALLYGYKAGWMDKNLLTLALA